MAASATTFGRVTPYIVIAATAATIVFNWLAATGRLNGVTAGDVSDKYPTILTPAGYAFSIWSLIYLGLVAFSIRQAFGSDVARLRSVRSPYLITCALNCAWLYFWHHEMLAACVITIFLLAAVLVFILIRTPRARSLGEAAVTTGVFGIYAGWVACASLVNLVIFLGTSGVDPQNVILGIAAVVAAAASAMIVRWKLRNYLYPLAVAWALGAIAVGQSGKTAIVIAAVFGTVAALVTAGSIVVELKDSTSEGT